MPYAFAAATTFLVAVVATGVVRRFALRFDIVDHPGEERKIHKRVTPLLGGFAVIVAVCVALGLFWGDLTGGYLLPKHLLGLIVGGGVLALGGAVDDKFNLSPAQQILFPVVAAVVVIASGIGIDYLSNPFGDTIALDAVEWQLFEIHGTPYFFTLWSDLFTFAWMMGMMYTTKMLDGLDGLVSGVSVIGAAAVAWLSLTAVVFQPETALVAVIGGAAFAGFLVWNWNPARIFLGKGGSLYAGFFLGALAILSGGKIATVLLIVGIPLLDVIWVIARRLFVDKTSPFKADRKHLHLRLVDAGLSQKQAVLALYALAVLFGLVALFLESELKVVGLVVLMVVMVVMAWALIQREQHHDDK